MRIVLAFVLSIAVLFQSLNKIVILANYQLNKTTITKNFCENKNKPQMHCNGKCHLAKKLKEEDKKQQNPINDTKDKSEVQYTSLLEEIKWFNDISEVIFSRITPKTETGITLSVFHPPLV